MPTYQYECDACGHAFEILQSMTAEKLKKCPECGKMKLHRLIGAGTGIIFKGSGFYETDYKKGRAGKAGDPGSKPAKKSEAQTPQCPLSDSDGCKGCSGGNGQAA